MVHCKTCDDYGYVSGQLAAGGVESCPSCSEAFDHKAENLRVANEFAIPGTVMHFAMRLGFMPHNEKAAEDLLEFMIKRMEEYETYCGDLEEAKSRYWLNTKFGEQ
jgi:hypothetical protein